MEYNLQDQVSVIARENPTHLEVTVLYEVPRDGKYIQGLRINGGGILPAYDADQVPITERIVIEPEAIENPQNMPQPSIKRVTQLAPAQTLHALYKQLQAFAIGKPGVHSDLAQKLLEGFEKAGIEQRIAVLKLL